MAFNTKGGPECLCGPNVTSFISLIFATTEWLLFAKRFFESLLTVEESVHLTIGASGILGRKLIRTDDGGPFPPIYKTDVPKFEIKRIATVSDLRADPEAIARKIVRQIFEFYNWNDPDESMLVYFQERLIQRQF